MKHFINPTLTFSRIKSLINYTWKIVVYSKMFWILNRRNSFMTWEKKSFLKLFFLRHCCLNVWVYCYGHVHNVMKDFHDNYQFDNDVADKGFEYIYLFTMLSWCYLQGIFSSTVCGVMFYHRTHSCFHSLWSVCV